MVRNSRLDRTQPSTVNTDSIHPLPGLEEPKSESPEAGNLVYSAPSKLDPPRDTNPSEAEDVPKGTASLSLPIASDIHPELQESVKNLTTNDSVGPFQSSVNAQNKTAASGKLPRVSSNVDRSTLGYKKYKWHPSNDPSRDPFDIVDVDTGSSQELPHGQISNKAKIQQPQVSNSTSTSRSFSRINDITDKEGGHSSQKSFSESSVHIAASFLRSTTSAGRHDADSSLPTDAPIEAGKTVPESSISQSGDLLLSQTSDGPLLPKEGRDNLTLVDNERDSSPHKKRKAPGGLHDIEGRSGLPEEDLQKAKRPKTSAAVSFEPQRHIARMNRKNDKFEAEDITKGPRGGGKRNPKALASKCSPVQDQTPKQKIGRETAKSEAVVKDKPSNAGVPTADGERRGNKGQASALLPIGPDHEQAATTVLVESLEGREKPTAKQLQGILKSSTPKPGAARSISFTSPIPRQRSAGFRPGSTSSKNIPARDLGTGPAKIGPSDIAQSSPTEQRRNAIPDPPVKTTRPPVLRRPAPSNGRTKEKVRTKSVTLEAEGSKQLDGPSTMGKSEPPPLSASNSKNYSSDLHKMALDWGSRHRSHGAKDKGKQNDRKSSLPPKAELTDEIVDFSDSEIPSTVSRRKGTGLASKPGPPRVDSTSKESAAISTDASTKHSLSTPQGDITTVAKPIQKDKNKSMSKPTGASDRTSVNTASYTNSKKDLAEKENKKTMPESTEKGEVRKSTQQTLDASGKDAATCSNRNTSLDSENAVAQKSTSAESKSPSRSPAKEVFSPPPSAMSETESDSGSGSDPDSNSDSNSDPNSNSNSDSDGESESEEHSAPATNSRGSNSNDIGKPRIPERAKSSKDETKASAASASSGSDSEEDEIPLPKPPQHSSPVSHDKHKSPETSVKPPESHDESESGTESDDDSPGRQLQREEKQSSQAKIASSTSKAAPTSSKTPHNAPKTPSTIESSRPPTSSQFKTMSSIAASAANTIANGHSTAKLPGFKMPLKSPVTPVLMRLLDGALDEETSEEENSSDEDDDDEIPATMGATKASQSSGKGVNHSFSGLMKCEFFRCEMVGISTNGSRVASQTGP